STACRPIAWPSEGFGGSAGRTLATAAAARLPPRTAVAPSRARLAPTRATALLRVALARAGDFAVARGDATGLALAAATPCLPCFDASRACTSAPGNSSAATQAHARTSDTPQRAKPTEPRQDIVAFPPRAETIGRLPWIVTKKREN